MLPAAPDNAILIAMVVLINVVNQPVLWAYRGVSIYNDALEKNNFFNILVGGNPLADSSLILAGVLFCTNSSPGTSQDREAIDVFDTPAASAEDNCQNNFHNHQRIVIVIVVNESDSEFRRAASIECIAIHNHITS